MAIAFRSSDASTTSSGTTVTVNVPAGVVDGDVLLFVVGTTNSGASLTTPAGWTALVNQRYNSNSNGYGVFWRVANSEPASYTVTMSVTASARGFMAAYTGVDNTTPIDVSGTVNTGTSGGPSCLSVTTTTPNTVAIATHTNSASPTSITVPTFYTEREAFVGVLGLSFSERLRTSAGATGNATVALGTSRSWATHQFALREAAASATNVRNRALIQGM